MSDDVGVFGSEGCVDLDGYGPLDGGCHCDIRESNSFADEECTC